MENSKNRQHDNASLLSMVLLAMAFVLLVLGLVGYIDNMADKEDEKNRVRDAQDVVQCSKMCEPHGVLSWSHAACVCQEAE